MGDAEVVLALGGGSTIDTAKRVSADDWAAARLRADDVLGLGVDATSTACATRTGACDGGGGGAHNEAIVYDVELTLGMPRT